MTAVYEMAYGKPGDLVQVRAFVRESAALLGLSEARADLLTLAVCELATNTLQHAAGGGLVRVFTEPGRLLCDVIDAGTVPLLGRTMPAADAVRGRGLAIVERICDEVGVVSEDGSTRIRLTLLL